MSPTEALALLASVDDPHVVEAGRVLARLLPEHDRWFDSGREAERAAVVAWLRAQRDESYSPPIPFVELAQAAQAIERGEHREGE